MSEKDKKDPNRRDFIITATATVGAVGAGAAVWPLIDQMNPDASVKALASTEVDVSNIQPGQSITTLLNLGSFRRKPQGSIISSFAPRQEQVLAIDAVF